MMKRNVLFRGLAAILMLALITTSCNKEEDPPEFQQLSFDSEAVLEMVPDGLKNSTDEYAQDCYSFIEDAVDMSQFIDNMEVPEEAQKSQSKAAAASETWQWTWYYGGESFTFYWSYEESGGKRYWTMDIQYGSGPRYKYIEAWEYTDGTGGEVSFNSGWAAAMEGEEIGEDEYLYWRYTWSVDDSGAYHLEYKVDAADAEYDYLIQIETVINADGSGTIDYYYVGQLFYHMEWDVLGNGSWAYYMDGEMFMEGTWTAGV